MSGTRLTFPAWKADLRHCFLFLFVCGDGIPRLFSGGYRESIEISSAMT